MAEAIVAMFVLLGGFTVLFRLFHTAVHYSNIVDSQQNKVRIALNKLEEIRAWSRSVHEPVGNVAFDNQWPYWHDQTGVDDENPEIRWKVEVISHHLYSPCSTFESIKPVAERRSMERSCKQVIVRVNNGDPETTGLGMGAQPVVLTALIGQPSIAPIPQAGNPQLYSNMAVDVSGPPVSLGHNQIAATPYTASLKTTSGREILDVFFLWNTLGDAAGSMLQVGPGTNAVMQVQHRIKMPDGSFLYSVPGLCQAVATCKFRGYTIYNQNSSTITLHD